MHIIKKNNNTKGNVGEIPCPFVFAVERQTNIVSFVVFFNTMLNKQSKLHILSLATLSLVTIVWGYGFVANKQLLSQDFAKTPALLNAIRFSLATVALAVVFAKKIKPNKQMLKYALLSGTLLFGGFLMQTLGLKYTTPSHNGFCTVSYVVLVPFICWIIYKNKPAKIIFVGATLALVGLAILNFGGETLNEQDYFLGDMLSLVGALCYAFQFIVVDVALHKKKIDNNGLCIWQIAVTALCFCLYSVVVEGQNYSQLNVDVGYCWWRMLIVALLGVAYAYWAQNFSQKHLSPSETSLVLACESPIGAIISVALCLEQLSWSTVVGGALVFVAVLLVVTVSVKKDETAPCD